MLYTKLIKNLKNHGVVIGNESGFQLDHDPVYILGQCVRYEVSNVAKLFWHDQRAEDGTWELGDPIYFPDLSPQHPYAWYEWLFDKDLVNGIVLRDGTHNVTELLGLQGGALSSMIDRRQKDLPPHYQALFSGKPESVRWFNHLSMFLSTTATPDVTYRGAIKTYICEDGSVPMVPPATDQGDLPGKDVGDSRVYIYPDMGLTEADNRSLAHGLGQHSKAVFLTICFLNQRNIIEVDVNPFAKVKPKRLERVKARSPLVEHKIIAIHPLRDHLKVKKGEVKPNTNLGDGMKSGGDCWRTYTEERPMFGKPWGVGRFYIPSYGNTAEKKEKPVRKVMLD